MSARLLPTPPDTEQIGAHLAQALLNLGQGMLIGLSGDLGAGKTTLARALIRSLGHAGVVASPSYSLVEPYRLCARSLYHLDLYRLADPEELEFIGLRDWDFDHDWLLVEWPQRGAGVLPQADVTLHLHYALPGRRLRLTASSDRGRALLAALPESADERVSSGL